MAAEGFARGVAGVSAGSGAVVMTDWSGMEAPVWALFCARTGTEAAPTTTTIQMAVAEAMAEALAYFSGLNSTLCAILIMASLGFELRSRPCVRGQSVGRFEARFARASQLPSG
jgi:hypothetical protein